LKQLPLLVGLRLRESLRMESNHRGLAYETSLLQGTQRLRRHDLHVRPSAHEADELLLLHSAVP
jgi:hypothetical protein